MIEISKNHPNNVESENAEGKNVESKNIENRNVEKKKCRKAIDENNKTSNIFILLR
jgi:hypothetical protein